MHTFYSIADIGNGPELLKLYVEEMNDVNSKDTAKRAYQLQNIEKQQVVVTGSQNNTVSRSNQPTVLTTISDLFALVKQKDSSFNPNTVNESLLNDDGTPKVFYHGTNADFTVFDRSKRSKKISLAAPVKISGVRGNVAVAVNMHSNKYSVHRILLPDGSSFKFSEKNNEVKQESYQGVTENSSLADTTSFTSDNSIPNSSKNVNVSSKNSLPINDFESLHRSNIEKVTELSRFAAQMTAHIDNIVDMIINESVYMKPEISDYAKEVLREVRSGKIKLSEAQKETQQATADTSHPTVRLTHQPASSPIRHGSSRAQATPTGPTGN